MKTYTIKELRNAPIQIRVYSEEQAIQLAYALGYETNWKPFGAIYPIFCFLYDYNYPSWNSSSIENKPTIIEFNQIENFMENKKIIEFKVNSEFTNLSEALFKQCSRDSKGGYGRFDVDSNVKDFYEKAGVLDLWFEPVYEQVKQIVKMYSSNKGEFEIEVVDGKAYYRPENKELPKEWIKSIINSFNTTIIDGSYMETPYKITISSLNVGCYHDCKKEDWENVYKLLK